MSLIERAETVAERLGQAKLRIVLAESCTAGLVSATLARVPGISNWLCGSAVTYRAATKQAWLDVSEHDLAQFTAVSDPVADQMATGVLRRTAEADVAVSVTGHLGPDAPLPLDGVIFVGVAKRRVDGTIECVVERHQLQHRDRLARQEEAAGLVLAALADNL